MTDEELRTAATTLRVKAEAVGPMRADWDLIFDIEGILAGRETLLSRETVEAMISSKTKAGIEP